MDPLKAAADAAPERVAVDHAHGVWRYDELNARADARARALRRPLAACRPGSTRVALLLESGAPLIAWLHAVPRAEAGRWLMQKQAEGYSVDLKVWGGLWLLEHAPDGSPA